ncbi:MAG: hypothetical protein J6L71_05490 [Clostridia bacterium]|nr:hypothetical protein [Clostridia bacterium]
MGIVDRLIMAKYSIKRSMKINKKGWIIGISIFLLLCAFAVYSLCFYTYFSIDMHPINCEYLFGCTPDEFISGKVNLPAEVLSLRKNAYIDENGKLILCYSYLQQYRIRKSEWLKKFPELDEWACISLAEDYSSITITVTPEMRNYDSGKLNELEEALHAIYVRIRHIDILNDEQSLERDIKYKEIDGVTGEILFEDNIIFTSTQFHAFKITGW